MDNNNDTATQAAYASLPQEIRDLIVDPTTFERIEVIGKKFELGRVEIGLLVQATGALLTGVIKPNEFVGMLGDYLSFPQEKAALLAQELNRDIFNPVKDALKRIHGMGEKEKASPAPVVSPYNTAIETEKPAIFTEAAPALTAPQQQKPLPIIAAVPAQKTEQVVAAPQIKEEKVTAAATPPAMTSAPFVPVTVPEEKPVSNNLESKLGGTFTIKKDIMYTQQGTPAPLTPTVTPPQTVSAKTAVTDAPPPLPISPAVSSETAPAAEIKTEKKIDPYREPIA